MSHVPQWQVPQWEVFERTLSGTSEGNPFLEVDLSATFSCGSELVEVAGFYDGDGIYRIRFMPSLIGTWTFRTSSNQRELDGHAGEVVCEPSPSGRHGPVGVVDDFGFAHADGTPFHPFGTTCYAWTHQPPEIRRRTTEALRRAPFNKIRMCVFPKSYAHNTIEPDTYPFPVVEAGSSNVSGAFDPGALTRSDWRFDTERFDPAFFRNLDHCVRQLGELGVEADIILFHPYDRWGFANLPPEVEDRYLRYVIARLAAFRNVWWSLANEYDLVTTKAAADWERILRILAEHDPYGHLRSIHNFFKFYDHSNPLLTHVSAQHDDPRRAALWRATYGKPVVVDECGYEGDIIETWGNLSGEEMVRRCWHAVAHGGYVTHGETFDGDDIWWAQGGSLRGESIERIAFLRRLLEAAPPGLEPIHTSEAHGRLQIGNREDFDLAGFMAARGTAPAPPSDDGTPIRWAFPGVHQPHEYYLIYLDARQPKAMVADVPAGEQYSATVIDTWQMTTTVLPDLVGRGSMVPLPTRPYLALELRRRA